MDLFATLLHVPKLQGYYKAFGTFTFINLMPQGLLALADHLDRHGFATRVVHAGVERIVEPGCDVVARVLARRPRLVGLPLFWHHQSYDAVETARRLKAADPSLTVVLGGYTASIYHLEIVREFPFVDGVIRGDGEKPLLELARAIQEGRGFHEVPNLTWRDGQDVTVNPHGYLADSEAMDGLRFAQYHLLDHHDVYLEEMGLPYFYLTGVGRTGNHVLMRKITRLFPCEVGRGCMMNCTWCGGGRQGQKAIAERNRVHWRSHDRVMADLEHVVSYGVKSVGLFFDPTPGQSGWYQELFRRLRERGLGLDCYFESWGLPDDDFLRAFKATFPGPESVISMSPESAVETVRKRNKSFFFTNAQMEAVLERMRELDLGADLFFAVGLPGETLTDFHRTSAWINDLRSRFPNLQETMIFTIELEPGSPWLTNPEKFGIVPTRQTFRDYYLAHSRQTRPLGDLGYLNPGFFPDGRDGGDLHTFEDEIQLLRCRHQCLMQNVTLPAGVSFRSPLVGNSACSLLDSFWRLKGAGPARERAPVPLPTGPG